jgi:DNA-binding CsgD family transcriptional regulator
MVATAGALGAAYLLFGLHAKTGLANLVAVPCLVVVFAVEEAVRARRAQKAMLEERARHAEESREQQERQRVQERIYAERLRIARELHDAVGHHVALISVQAGAMSYLLETDPARARESLTHIQHASEAALDELRLTVGLLRQPGESEPTEPAGKLSCLDELIGSFAATGLKVTCEGGFLGKGSRPEVLVEAILTVARGEALLSPAATRGLIARYLTLNDPGPAAEPGLLDALTDREREIVALVATGMSNAEIADHLTLSPLTVKTHANHAMTKLGARDRAQLVVLAYAAGLAGAQHRAGDSRGRR